ncbi:MAG: FAD-dependent oxidoreductase [Longimicrobiales bacterium]|nr:FAD-dependent oxidoreductase [Longimicrobiales bacterium]
MKIRTDVAVVGGGLAGLSLARQLRSAMPDIDVTVIDRARRPAVEKTSTVGESFAELGSHYLREVVGLGDHLDGEQLPKFGLRFFVGDAWDMGERFELGVLDPIICELEDNRLVGLPLRTHQVDRARLENELATLCVGDGVRLVEGSSVRSADVDPTGHRLHVSGDAEGVVECRWAVGAAGHPVPGLEPPHRPLGHRLRAAWFRAEGHLDVGSWSTLTDFHRRTPPGFRRLSTNHLMGSGFWIWIIPLPSGVTSVGVVADRDAVSDFHPNGYDDLLTWIEGRDPRLYHELQGTSPVDGDFHVADADAFVARSFDERRLAVVGGAACFVDVLYSPGADLIALGNTLLVDLVRRDLEDGRIAGACAAANRIFEGFADGLGEIYRGQYPNFDRPEIVGAKAVWDSALYFGFNTLLFRHGLSTDLRFLSSIQPELLTLRALQARVQSRLRDGRITPIMPGGDATVEWGHVGWLMDAYYGARTQPDDWAVVSHLRSVLASLEGVARRLEGRS